MVDESTPEIPATPDVPAMGTVAPGGKGGGNPYAGLDPKAVAALKATEAARAPLVQQSSDIEAQRQQDVADQLQKASLDAKIGYQNNLSDLDVATKAMEAHNAQIRDKYMSMTPIASPSELWNRKDTGDKLAAGIGVLLGGAPVAAQIQRALEADFEADKANHEMDFKRYAAAHGLDEDDYNKALYLNSAKNAYVRNAFALAVGPELQAKTASANSQQAKVNGQAGLLEIQDHITRLDQQQRSYLAQAAAAGRTEYLRIQKAAQDYAAKVQSENGTPLQQGLEDYYNANPQDKQFMLSKGAAPPDMQADAVANNRIARDLSDLRKTYKQAGLGDPPPEAQRQVIESHLGTAQSDGSYGSSVNWTYDPKTGSFTHARSWTSAEPPVSNKARQEGRVIQYTNPDGSTKEVEVIDKDMGTMLQKFRDPAQKAGHALDILQDSNESLEHKQIAFGILKDLQRDLETGTTRVAGDSGNGIINALKDFSKQEDLSHNPQLIQSLRDDINKAYRDTANSAIRGGYKGPDLLGGTKITPPAPPGWSAPSNQATQTDNFKTINDWTDTRKDSPTYGKKLQVIHRQYSNELRDPETGNVYPAPTGKVYDFQPNGKK